MDISTAPTLSRHKRCGECADGIAAPFAFSMAYQPIVDIKRGQIYAFEALVRGPEGQSAPSVLNQVTLANRYAFDQSCRVRAIEMAARLGLSATGARLSINFIPGAMYRPEACVQATLTAARRCGIPNRALILELTENEEVLEPDLLARIFHVYRQNDLRISIDEFGAGFSGLALLARFQPDAIKIDMDLVRSLETDARRRTIVQGIVRIAAGLAVDVVAEGVETAAELAALRDTGVELVQGYLFAKPGFEVLPAVAW